MSLREILFPSLSFASFLPPLPPSLLSILKAVIKKSLLTAPDLKEAVVRVEGVVVELHPAGDRDRHSGWRWRNVWFEKAIYWAACLCDFLFCKGNCDYENFLLKTEVWEKRVLLFPNQVFFHLELYWTSSFILKQTCIQEKALTNFNRPLRKSSENSATWRYIRGFCSS